MSPVEPDPKKGLNGAVAAELRATKARRQLSNQQVAERSKIPLVSVNRYLAGKRPISLAVLQEIAKSLDTDPGMIVSSALSELEREPGTSADSAEHDVTLRETAGPDDVDFEMEHLAHKKPIGE